jgi:hypothetical protein
LALGGDDDNEGWPNDDGPTRRNLVHLSNGTRRHNRSCWVATICGVVSAVFFRDDRSHACCTRFLPGFL